MYELGFDVDVVSKKKGTFVDDHEREDVVAYQTKFVRRMVSLGFFNPDNAPTDEAKNALPSDLGPPLAEVIEKTVLFHDETRFKQSKTNLHSGLRRGQVLCVRSQGAVGSWFRISSARTLDTFS